MMMNRMNTNAIRTQRVEEIMSREPLALSPMMRAGEALARLCLLGSTDFYVALAVSLTLIVTVTCAKLLGCCLPILASRLKLDPAVMASPLITTIADAVSLFVYFRIAVCLLKL